MNPSQIKICYVASMLDRLQAEKNDGRGVSCVRSIVAFLKHGDVESAQAVLVNEGDKIRNYPDIEKFLNKYVRTLEG